MLSPHLAGGKTLPVFGPERDAARFVEAWNQQNQQLADDEMQDLHEGWRGRGTGTGELISLLSGSAFAAGTCGGVERIVLDPPLEIISDVRRGARSGVAGPKLHGVSRACFLEHLMGRGRAWFDGARRG